MLSKPFFDLFIYLSVWNGFKMWQGCYNKAHTDGWKTMLLNVHAHAEHVHHKHKHEAHTCEGVCRVSPVKTSRRSAVERKRLQQQVWEDRRRRHTNVARKWPDCSNYSSSSFPPIKFHRRLSQIKLFDLNYMLNGLFCRYWFYPVSHWHETNTLYFLISWGCCYRILMLLCMFCIL